MYWPVYEWGTTFIYIFCSLEQSSISLILGNTQMEKPEITILLGYLPRKFNYPPLDSFASFYIMYDHENCIYSLENDLYEPYSDSLR